MSASKCRSVNCGGEDVGSIGLNPFHDVLLPALWPTDTGDVDAQHPERRPQARTHGKLHPSFDAPVLKLRQSLCLHAAGSPVSAGVSRLNNQVAIAILKDVWVAGNAWRRVGAGRAIGLDFTITKAPASRIVRPFCGVGSRALRAVEFIVPYQSPVSLADCSGANNPVAASGECGQE